MYLRFGVRIWDHGINTMKCNLFTSAGLVSIYHRLWTKLWWIRFLTAGCLIVWHQINYRLENMLSHPLTCQINYPEKQMFCKFVCSFVSCIFYLVSCISKYYTSEIQSYHNFNKVHRIFQGPKCMATVFGVRRVKIKKK